MEIDLNICTNYKKGKTDFSILMISNYTSFFLANFDAKHGNSVSVEMNTILDLFFFFSSQMEYLMKRMCKIHWCSVFQFFKFCKQSIQYPYLEKKKNKGGVYVYFHF